MGFSTSLGLIDHRYHYPEQLSGGEAARAGLAVALAATPKILLADEPTGEGRRSHRSLGLGTHGNLLPRWRIGTGSNAQCGIGSKGVPDRHTPDGKEITDG